ncbi:hypothetical protein DFH09DRAFT_223254 [Mycena vulgaris]|nr:hypothetical protein DFH09DRAFT_223254 [Mycena vulgaris]
MKSNTSYEDSKVSRTRCCTSAPHRAPAPARLRELHPPTAKSGFAATWNRGLRRAHAPLCPPGAVPAHVVPAIASNLKPHTADPRLPPRLFSAGWPLHAQRGGGARVGVRRRCPVIAAIRRVGYAKGSWGREAGGGSSRCRSSSRARLGLRGFRTRGHLTDDGDLGYVARCALPRPRTHPRPSYVSYPARARRPQEHHEPSTALKLPSSASARSSSRSRCCAGNPRSRWPRTHLRRRIQALKNDTDLRDAYRVVIAQETSWSRSRPPTSPTSHTPRARLQAPHPLDPHGILTPLRKRALPAAPPRASSR